MSLVEEETSGGFTDAAERETVEVEDGPEGVEDDAIGRDTVRVAPFAGGAVAVAAAAAAPPAAMGRDGC